MLGGPGGFGGAPVTQGLVASSFALSVMGTFLPSDYFSLNLRAITGFQFWRIFTCHFAFRHPTEIFLGLLLLYFFRVFERQRGSKKFAGVLLAISSISTLLQLIFLVIFDYPYTTSGPYAFIFGLLPFFFRDIPQTKWFKVIGLMMNDKTFVYVLALQVAAIKPPVSLFTAFSGILAGVLYRTVPLLRSIRVPARLTEFCATHVAPLLQPRRRRGYARVAQDYDPYSAAPAPIPQAQAADDGDVLIPGFAGPGAGLQMQALPPVQPNPDAMRQLVSMGFSEASAREALIATRNDINAATNRLLMS